MPPNSKVSVASSLIDDDVDRTILELSLDILDHHASVLLNNEVVLETNVACTPKQTKADDETKQSPSRDETTVVEKFFGAILGKVTLLMTIGFFIIYEGNSIGYLFVMRNFVWIIAMIISIGQDDVYNHITKMWHWGTATTISCTDHHHRSTAAQHPCTIEYNHQVQIITGILTYCIALLILLFFDPSIKLSSLASSFVKTTETQLHFYSESVVRKDPAGMNLAKIFEFKLIEYAKAFLTYLNDWSLEVDHIKYSKSLYHTVTILASFYVFERSWTAFFTNNLETINRQPRGLRYIESKLSFPILLLTMFIVQDPMKFCIMLNINSSILCGTIRSLLYSWIIFKLFDYVVQYNTNQRVLRTSTFPEMLMDTTVTQKRQASVLKNALLPGSNASQVGTKPSHDLVWNIYGNQYDVTTFVPHHPGGVESIMLAANREDATALFQSYHPFNIRNAKAVLEKYRIPSKETTATVDNVVVCTSSGSSNNTVLHYGHENDAFYDILCQRVAKCLQETYNIHPIYDRAATWYRVMSYIPIVGVTLFAFYKHCQGSIFYSIIFAVAGDFCGAHIGHDGGHFAISRTYPRLNDIGVWAFSVISNPITWQHQHTYAHHSFTNDEHKDPDLHHFKGAFKLRPNEEVGNHYLSIVDIMKSNGGERKFFFWFLMFMFTQVSTGLCYFFPWVFVFDRSLHGVVTWSDRRQLHRTAQLITHWLLYMVAIVYIPFLAHSNSWWALVQVLAHTMTTSFIFSATTQVGHLSDAALNLDHISEQRTKRHPVAQKSWAAEQIVTSQDFAPQSNFMFFAGGGLSIQIEHHLFPGLNHCHLMKIQPIVEEVCKEFNVSYTKYDTWFDAWTVTIKYLTDLAQQMETGR